MTKINFEGELLENDARVITEVIQNVDIVTLSTDSAPSGSLTIVDTSDNKHKALRLNLALPQGQKGESFKYEDFTPAQLAFLKGEKGEQGFTGAQGLRGEKGEKGDTGYTPQVTVDPNVVTLSAGENARVEDTNEDLRDARLKFYIPRGPKGEKGDTGTSSWNDITNKPTFATVATSGDYSDLNNAPTLPPSTITINLEGAIFAYLCDTTSNILHPSTVLIQVSIPYGYTATAITPDAVNAITPDAVNSFVSDPQLGHQGIFEGTWTIVDQDTCFVVLGSDDLTDSTHGIADLTSGTLTFCDNLTLTLTKNS